MEVQLPASLGQLLGKVCGSAGALGYETTYTFFLLKKPKIKPKQPPQTKPQFLAGTRPLLLLSGLLLG